MESSIEPSAKKPRTNSTSPITVPLYSKNEEILFEVVDHNNFQMGSLASYPKIKVAKGISTTSNALDV